MKIFSLLLFATLLAGCAGTPTVTHETGEDEYHSLLKVKHTQLDHYYIADKDALKGYSAMYFEPLDMDNMELDLTRLDFQEREWELEENEKQAIVGYYDQKVASEFGRSDGLALARQKGPGVIAVQTTLTKFYPSATRYDSAYRGPRDEVFTRSVGLLKMKTTLTDSQTGELLAVILDDDEVGENSLNKSNDRVNNVHRLKLTFGKWVSYIREASSELAN